MKRKHLACGMMAFCAVWGWQLSVTADAAAERVAVTQTFEERVEQSRREIDERREKNRQEQDKWFREEIEKQHKRAERQRERNFQWFEKMMIFAVVGKIVGITLVGFILIKLFKK